jgi:polyisoprenoid-binding protein YceI
MWFRLMGVSVLLAAVATAIAQERPIDTQRSRITIHVGKVGLFSAAAHNHLINAPISSGKINEAVPQQVEFTVEAAKMTVEPDPKVDAKDQATIQKHMQEMTLESARYPEIHFRSTRVERVSNSDWKVEGELSLHGVTKPVSLGVKESGGAYLAHTVLKQTDFGIKPISIGGGIIKVKNEIELDFQIFPAQE